MGDGEINKAHHRIYRSLVPAIGIDSPLSHFQAGFEFNRELGLYVSTGHQETGLVQGNYLVVAEILPAHKAHQYEADSLISFTSRSSGLNSAVATLFHSQTGLSLMPLDGRLLEEDWKRMFDLRKLLFEVFETTIVNP